MLKWKIFQVSWAKVLWSKSYTASYKISDLLAKPVLILTILLLIFYMLAIFAFGVTTYECHYLKDLSSCSTLSQPLERLSKIFNGKSKEKI